MSGTVGDNAHGGPGNGASSSAVRAQSWTKKPENKNHQRAIPY